MKNPSRRTFLKTSALASAAMLSRSAYGAIQGANSDIRIVVCGIRQKGRNHVEVWSRMPGVRLVGICDPDSDLLNAMKDRVDRRYSDTVPNLRLYKDVREVLNDPEVDAISIAAPNHWHSLMTIWACQAGKDVYCEKPMSHHYMEGLRVIKVVEQSGRIVQHGTQRRSDGRVAAVAEYLKEGHLGKIQLVRGLCYRDRPSIGKVSGPQPIPSNIDIELWTGPAPMLPLTRKSLHYDWHWVWNTGNGDLGNQGIHQVDVCRWFAGHDAPAPRVIGLGGRFGYEDDGETPNTQLTYYDYPDVPILFECRGLPLMKASGDQEAEDDSDTDGPGATRRGAPQLSAYRGRQVDVIVHCEGGIATETQILDENGERITRLEPLFTENIFENWVRAVQEQDPGILRAPMTEGHPSCAIMHQGNIAYQVGKAENQDAIAERFGSLPFAAEAFGRMSEHLLVNRVRLDRTPVVIGPWLEFDANSNRFIGEGAAEANAMLDREDRAPFVIADT